MVYLEVLDTGLLSQMKIVKVDIDSRLKELCHGVFIHFSDLTKLFSQ